MLALDRDPSSMISSLDDYVERTGFRARFPLLGLRSMNRTRIDAARFLFGL